MAWNSGGAPAQHVVWTTIQILLGLSALQLPVGHAFVFDVVFNGTRSQTTPESFSMLELKPESTCSACFSEFDPPSRPRPASSSTPVATPPGGNVQRSPLHDTSDDEASARPWTVLTPTLLAVLNDQGDKGQWSSDETGSNWHTVGRLEFQPGEPGWKRMTLDNAHEHPFVEFRNPSTLRFSAIRALMDHMKRTGRNRRGLVFTMSEGSPKGE